MRKRITASIVVYKNDIEILKKAVNSFLSSSDDSILYLIDNSPTDECGKYFRDPRVHYIFNNENLGFGAAHNIALNKVIEEGNSHYHLVLNPDVYFDGNVIQKLVAFMDENRTIGLVMPKVLYPDGRLQPLCKLLPSPFTLFTRRFLSFKPSWVSRVNHSYELHFTGYDKIMDVPFLSGCFMFLRVDALRHVGTFDERIFLYTEDADLSRRIHQYYRTVFFPEVSIYHYHQRRSYKNLGILLYHIGSAVTYFNKWGWFIDYERKFINKRVLLKLSR
jgi:GT2 family glycosyltransferase